MDIDKYQAIAMLEEVGVPKEEIRILSKQTMVGPMPQTLTFWLNDSDGVEWECFFDLQRQKWGVYELPPREAKTALYCANLQELCDALNTLNPDQD